MFGVCSKKLREAELKFSKTICAGSPPAPPRAPADTPQTEDQLLEGVLLLSSARVYIHFTVLSYIDSDRTLFLNYF